jgi:two-component system CheB/CheR fusion protein
MNEELQTSKEELESANEELNTVNEEMQSRNYQLSQANNDLLNLVDSVSVPILMLGSDLTIRRFTPWAEEFLGLNPADVGRTLLQVRLRPDIPGFEPMMLEVMRAASPRQQDFQHDGTQYRVRVTPYRTADNKVEGVVAVFLDLTDPGSNSPAQKNQRSKARGKY